MKTPMSISQMKQTEPGPIAFKRYFLRLLKSKQTAPPSPNWKMVA